MTDKAILDRTGWHYFLAGQEVSQEEYEKVYPPPESKGTPGASLVGWKPLASQALKVHPRQIKEAREKAAAAGVPTDYTEIGEPIFTSRSHRKAFLKYRGLVDRDGGYSD